MTQHTHVAVLIPVKNAAETLVDTLDSVTFAKEILCLDDGSTDTSPQLITEHGGILITGKAGNFADKRNALLHHSTQEWVLYVDADEVIPPELTTEILSITNRNQPGAYRLKRRNYFLGREMYQDSVERLFHRSLLVGWAGEVHEHPILKNGVAIQTLSHPLIHQTHRSIETMLHKTNEWSEIEADLRIKADHPPMAWWRLIRIATTTFIKEYMGKRLYRFGREGLFEAYFQMIDKVIVYTKLWERQQQGSRSPASYPANNIPSQSH